MPIYYSFECIYLLLATSCLKQVRLLAGKNTLVRNNDFLLSCERFVFLLLLIVLRSAQLDYDTVSPPAYLFGFSSSAPPPHPPPAIWLLSVFVRRRIVPLSPSSYFKGTCLQRWQSTEEIIHSLTYPHLLKTEEKLSSSSFKLMTFIPWCLSSPPFESNAGLIKTCNF